MAQTKRAAVRPRRVNASTISGTTINTFHTVRELASTPPGVAAVGRREVTLSRELTLYQEGWPALPENVRRLSVSFEAELFRDSNKPSDRYVILTLGRMDNSIDEKPEDQRAQVDVLLPIEHLRAFATAFNDLIADVEGEARHLAGAAIDTRLVTDFGGELTQARAG